MCGSVYMKHVFSSSVLIFLDVTFFHACDKLYQAGNGFKLSQVKFVFRFRLQVRRRQCVMQDSCRSIKHGSINLQCAELSPH
jgi:hypothetical protein